MKAMMTMTLQTAINSLACFSRALLHLLLSFFRLIMYTSQYSVHTTYLHSSLQPSSAVTTTPLENDLVTSTRDPESLSNPCIISQDG